MHNRPSEAVFADSVRRLTPLAILPKAMGVPYETYDATADGSQLVDGVSVMCIDGPLEHKPGWFLDYETIAARFQFLCNDARVSCIMLKFDSPGGDVAGLWETVRAMRAAKTKPVIAYVDEACYSAAYALASVADEIYVPEAGGVGSIGVITALLDCTEADKQQGVRVQVIASGARKTDGHPHVALTDEVVSRTQETINEMAQSFFAIVSESRGISVSEVESLEAGTFMGQSAVDVGLADGVMSIEECLTLAKQQYTKQKAPPREASKGKNQMAGQLAAAKALNDANKALRAAKTDADRALASARVLAAEENLAKVKRIKTTDKVIHTEEIDDGEEEAKPADKCEDIEEDEEEEMEEEDAEKAAAPKDSLLALCQQITGKSSLEEVMGALHGTWQGSKKTSSLASELAALKAEAEANKVSALVAEGMKAGKIAPSQKEWASKQSSSALAAYLEAAPKMVPTEEHTEASVNGLGVGAVSAEMAKIWRKQGFKEADFPKLIQKLNSAHGTNGANK